MARRLLPAIAVMLVSACASDAPAPPGDLDHEMHLALATTFADAPPEWQDRLLQDDLQKVCSVHRNHPPGDVAQGLVSTEQAALKVPEGALLGDWKAGEKVAQSGVGLQFSDPPGTRNGGNCYACHQLAKSEIAYGTLGPSLYQYGKLRGGSDAIARYTYQKIYDADAFMACSLMPRFGQHHILDEQQIKDLVAFLLDPASPVNQ